jgi:zinc protease
MTKFFATLIIIYAFSFVTPAHALPIEEVTSPSGIKIWLVQDHSVPLLSLQFSFAGGVEQDPIDKQGLSMLATNLLTQGAGDLDSAAFQQALADAAISLDISAGRDYLAGGFKTLTENIDRAAALTHLMLTQPRFDTAAVERARQQQSASIKRNLGDPDWQARRALFDQLFSGHPYAMRSLGTEKTLQAITEQDLRGFVAQRLTRDNLLIAATGDITPAAIGQIVDKIFSSLPQSEKLTPIEETTPVLDGKLTIVERPGPQSTVMFAAPGIKRNDKDWYAAVLLNYILGEGGFESRLMEEIRNQRGLTYGISTSLAPMQHGALLVGQAATDTAKTAEALTVLRQVWQQVFSTAITAKELQKSKDYINGSLPLAFSSTSAIAAILLGIQQDALPPDYLDHRPALFNAVTLTDIQRVAKRLLDPKFLTIIAVSEATDLKPDRTVPLAEQ